MTASDAAPVNVRETPIDVLCVGHALVDVLTGVDDSFLEAEGLVKGSMALIDADRATHLYEKMGPGREASGGSAANTATGVVACGGTAAFIGTVADDQLGEIFTHDIRAAGVEYRTPPLSQSPPTGRSMILITPDGERTMNTLLGAGAMVAVEHLDPEMMRAASITYVEGYLLDNAHSATALREAVSTLHNAGNKLAFTLSDPFCVERHRDLFLRLIEESVDICIGNEQEACMLFQTDDLDVAVTELTKRCEVVAITRGGEGSVLARGDERVEVQAVRTNVVDTTGAGDFYASGVLTGLAHGSSLEECGALGSKAAAAIVSQMGARLSRSLV